MVNLYKLKFHCFQCCNKASIKTSKKKGTEDTIMWIRCDPCGVFLANDNFLNDDFIETYKNDSTILLKPCERGEAGHIVDTEGQTIYLLKSVFQPIVYEDMDDDKWVLLNKTVFSKFSYGCTICCSTSRSACPLTDNKGNPKPPRPFVWCFTCRKFLISSDDFYKHMELFKKYCDSKWRRVEVNHENRRILFVNGLITINLAPEQPNPKDNPPPVSSYPVVRSMTGGEPPAKRKKLEELVDDHVSSKTVVTNPPPIEIPEIP